jgi:hypothetical protein
MCPRSLATPRPRSAAFAFCATSFVVSGLLQKVDGHYRHTPSSPAFLDPSSPACLASIVRFLSLPALREPYEHLADIVRKGRTVLPGEGSVEPENPIWVEFAQSMAPMMAPMAGPLGPSCWKAAPDRCAC